jgi:hypothetical protein
VSVEAGAASVRAGDEHRRLCSFYLWLMGRIGGVKFDRFGDATGRLAGI